MNDLTWAVYQRYPVSYVARQKCIRVAKSFEAAGLLTIKYKAGRDRYILVTNQVSDPDDEQMGMRELVEQKRLDYLKLYNKGLKAFRGLV